MKLPENKDFAFTIIDDTDYATLDNIKPVYDFLLNLGLKTSKSVWMYESRDEFTGTTLQDEDYLAYIKYLHDNGFEIFLHSVGSGDYHRNEILQGFEDYKKIFKEYPSIHANHSVNKNNIYWEPRYRFVYPLGYIMEWLQDMIRRKRKSGFLGNQPNSTFFWGDFCKKHIKYLRNLTFNELNITKVDKRMPYRIKGQQPYANYSFSASDGHTIEEFNALVTPQNIDKLMKEKGIAIVYTHLACGFFENGELHPEFKKNMEYLAKQNGWFVPTSTILNFLLSNQSSTQAQKTVNNTYQLILNIKWIVDRIKKAYLFRR